MMESSVVDLIQDLILDLNLFLDVLYTVVYSSRCYSEFSFNSGSRSFFGSGPGSNSIYLDLQ